MSSTSVTTNPTNNEPESIMGPLSQSAQANLYYLLAGAFSSPLEMGKEQPQKLLDLIPELPDSLQKPGNIVVKFWQEALDDRETLSLAYARLFLGPFEIMAPPYASFYLEPDQRLMGEVSRTVAQFYVESGLGPGTGPHEAPDHIALEWEFLYFLTYQYLTTKEDRWLQKHNEFKSSHLDLWLPSLIKAILKSGEHPFYHALAKFLSATVDL